MRKVVWKSRVPAKAWDKEGVELFLPEGAEVLHVDLQSGEPTMWIWCDPEAKIDDGRWFYIVGTGWDTDPSWAYRGTWQDEPFVWHLFEEVEELF